MAQIKLSVEAAHAVAASLKTSNLAFDVPECNCFANHDSQSKMMSEFEQRVNDVRELVVRYQALLANDVAALESACNAMTTSDHVQATMHQMLGQAGSQSGTSGGTYGRR